MSEAEAEMEGCLKFLWLYRVQYTLIQRGLTCFLQIYYRGVVRLDGYFYPNVPKDVYNINAMDKNCIYLWRTEILQKLYLNIFGH